MPFFNSGPIRYYKFNSLLEEGLVHAIFTRQGGCSPDPWESLNVGHFVGDDKTRVRENHRRAVEAVGRRFNSIMSVRQVHSSRVVSVDSMQIESSKNIPEGDAMVTRCPEPTLFMRFADCVPILYYDPVGGVAGIAHAGWRGTLEKLASCVILEMVSKFNSQPANILVGIGPSICASHYEVGLEVADQVKLIFGKRVGDVLYHDTGRVKFDLWTANKIVLEESGVENIELASICTACNPDDWYSHRGENGVTGRFGGVIGLSR